MTVATGFLIAPCTTRPQMNEAWKQNFPRKVHYFQLTSSKIQMHVATSFLTTSFSSLHIYEAWKCLSLRKEHCSWVMPPKVHLDFSSLACSCDRYRQPYPCLSSCVKSTRPSIMVCASSSAPSTSSMSTRLYVSGLSFRTSHESLRNAFEKFGELVEVNLVMDKIANRPRGFAFLRYKTEEESKNAIEGMHGKFLDGRVIFVEVAKPRSDIRKSQQTPRQWQR